MAISANHTKFEYPDYISPLPAETYLNAISYKQQQYDLGREQLQNKLDLYSQIKNEFVKPEDIQYFDNEMSNMLTEINKNAGLDFSVKANVNSVMNIGKPLENNQNLKQALISSKNYKTMIQEFQSLDPEQRGAANDYFFMKNINQYLSDGKAGSKLDYNAYNPYGIDKKAYGEVMKELNPTKETKIIFTPDGFIRKQVISGVSAERFQAAFLARVGETGARQLQMDAQYLLETQGKEAVATQYLFDQQQILEGLDKEISNLNAAYSQNVTKLGKNNPQIIELINQMDARTKQRNIIASRLNEDPSQISDSKLVNYIINENIRDVSGAYSYMSVEEDIKENPYDLEQFKSNLDMAEYQAKKEVDLIYEQEMVRRGLVKSKEGLYGPPTGAEETSSGLLKESQEVFNMAPILNQYYNEKDNDKFIAGFAKHFANADFKEDEEGRTIVTSRGKNTVKQALERMSSENTMNSLDYAEIVATLGGKTKAEQFFWTMKGLAGRLGVTTVPSDKIPNTFSVKDENNNNVDKKISPSSIVLVNYSRPGYKPYTKQMTVNSFLSLPADELLNVVSVNVKENTLISTEK